MYSFYGGLMVISICANLKRNGIRWFNIVLLETFDKKRWFIETKTCDWKICQNKNSATEKEERLIEQSFVASCGRSRLPKEQNFNANTSIGILRVPQVKDF